MSKREIAKCTFPTKVKGGTLVIEQLGRLVCPTQGDSKRKAKKYHTDKVRRSIRNGENREVQRGAGRCREVQRDARSNSEVSTESSPSHFMRAMLSCCRVVNT